MADTTAQSILEQEIPEKLTSKPELVKKIDAVLNFDVTGDGGGQWTVDCTKPSDWVASGLSDDPKMTITVGAEDLVKIKTKQLNPQMAFMGGKLKLKPTDMGLAMKLLELLT